MSTIVLGSMLVGRILFPLMVLLVIGALVERRRLAF